MSWPTVSSGEFMLKRGGSVNPSKFPDEVFDLLSIPAFDKGEIEVLEGKEIGSSKSCVQPDDVLLSKIIPHIRRCWVVPRERGRRQIGSGEWIIFRDERFDSNYLKHFLTSDIFHRQFMNTTAGVGGSLVRARPAQVEGIKIPLPPLKEQKRIAAILDKADAIRRKRQQAIKLADDFLRAVFLDMFGDPVTNPKGWEKVKLGDLTNIVRGGSPRPIQNYLGGSIPWIKIGDATKGNDIYIDSTKEKIIEAGLAKTRLLQPGAIIFANCGVSLGFARILKITGCIHDGWLALDVVDDRLSKLFLLKALNQITKYFQDTAPDGTQPNLNTTIMKDFELILPPLALQEKYVAIMHKINAFKDNYISSLTSINEMFSSTSQKAFSGKL